MERACDVIHPGRPSICAGILSLWAVVPAVVLAIVLPAIVAAQTAAPGTDAADTAAAAREASRDWEGRPRLQTGLAWLRFDRDESHRPLLYVAMNYRLTSNALPADDSRVHVGFGAEAGLFYLYPYVRVGPEARWGNFFAEAHGGGTLVFLVGTDTPGGAAGYFLGGSAGYIVRTEFFATLELGLGLDYIELFNKQRSAEFMPSVTVGFVLAKDE